MLRPRLTPHRIFALGARRGVPAAVAVMWAMKAPPDHARRI
ncbi:hypothetical protein [Jannaschia sp. S6380]|nr:hypothetical protein [Jannaschia sp. S6380]